MKSKILTAFSLFIPILGFAIAKDGEDLQMIDSLIASQERQIVIYKELHLYMAEFQKQQDRFAAGEETKELAAQMIHTASKILKIAEERQLLHLFTPFYIEELKLFSAIAKKKNP